MKNLLILSAGCGGAMLVNRMRPRLPADRRMKVFQFSIKTPSDDR